MGQCLCCERKASLGINASNIEDEYGHARPARIIHRTSGANRSPTATTSASSAASSIEPLAAQVRELVLETLSVIRMLVNNDQEPPAAMLKLNIIADKAQGWLLIIQTMIDVVPPFNPLGPAVITVFLDESPLPTKETVLQLFDSFHLSAKLANNDTKPPIWHRNLCIVLGCLAEKLAGPNSVATFRPDTLEYLLANFDPNRQPNVILFALIALEKYAQTSENKSTIIKHLNSYQNSPLRRLEVWYDSDNNFYEHQVGFCARWVLDNLFVLPERTCTYLTVDTKNINVMLNHNDVSEYLKISADGLEARCDVSSFESVRCTFQANQGVWYYEAVIITSGVMQIGWATKDSKFLNHEGYGIGDDEFSVAYDGCRQLIWHNASSHPHNHPPWRPGDVLGTMLDLDHHQVTFYLNGCPLIKPHTDVFQKAHGGFFAAASFMSFQQCRFNFGNRPFTYPPAQPEFRTFNDFAHLTEDQRVILPRHKKLELLRQISTQEGACSVCFSEAGIILLKPCNHSGFCKSCAFLLDQCPLCRAHINERVVVEQLLSINSVNLVEKFEGSTVAANHQNLNNASEPIGHHDVNNEQVSVPILNSIAQDCKV